MNRTRNAKAGRCSSSGPLANLFTLSEENLMETLHDAADIPPQPDPLNIPALATFLSDRSRPASVLADYLPSPVLSELEAYMAASGSAAVLKASQR